SSLAAAMGRLAGLPGHRGQGARALLQEFLSLRNGLLSHDTFSGVFRLLDPAAFGRVFEAFLDDLGAAATRL
ncbi:MAG TPA: hypothetical protein VM422_05445, partial [Amaricoccus sp.]|nr:hypothetical protein [Amaricoccus sp.]